MADSDDTSSSSDESFICDVQTKNAGIQAYQFEPKRGDTNSSSDSDSSSSSEGEDETSGRLTNTDWCLCGNCSVEFLERDRECLCCREQPATRDKDEHVCITSHPDFQLLCLTPVVLRNALVALNNIRADNWDVNPPNNRNLRHAAYRQMTWWVHGKLGSGRRKVIPACATHVLRNTFPAAPGEHYTGFSSGDGTDIE